VMHSLLSIKSLLLFVIVFPLVDVDEEFVR
jgi:hypothetical protein